MAQSAAQIAEGNAIVALLLAVINPATIIVDGPSPVTVARVIASIQTLIAND
jgi:hypothetical protein